MIVTEEEAKTKWCPKSRTDFNLGDGTSAAINRFNDGEIPNACKCIASRCMMWRSFYEPLIRVVIDEHVGPTYDTAEHRKKHGVPDNWIFNFRPHECSFWQEPEQEVIGKGWCGLSQSP